MYNGDVLLFNHSLPKNITTTLRSLRDVHHLLNQHGRARMQGKAIVVTSEVKLRPQQCLNLAPNDLANLTLVAKITQKDLCLHIQN